MMIKILRALSKFEAIIGLKARMMMNILEIIHKILR